MATASETKVIEAYIGLLGRAPDPTGLAYWTAQLDAAGGTTDALKKLTNDITLSAEWDAGLGAQKQADGSISQANANKIVGDMYLNLFERAATAADLTYWGDQLIAATVTPSEMAVLLIAAANENGTADGQTMGFKTQAATYYVESVAQSDFTRTTATNSVKDVAGPQTLETSKDATDAITTGVGVTVALTTKVDTVAMTGGDDTVTGTNLTSVAGDIIVDASTTDSDVLTITAGGAFALGTVTNVEAINVNIDATRATALAITGGATVTGTGTSLNLTTAATTTVNGQSIAGETRVTVDSLAVDATTTAATSLTVAATTNDAMTVTGDASLATLTVTGSGTNDTFAAVLANNDATLDYTGGAGAGDSVRVTAGGKLQLDAATVETVTILGKDEALAVDLNSATAVNLNVGGDQSVTITGAAAALTGTTFTDISTAGTTSLKVEGNGADNAVLLNKAGIVSGGISLEDDIDTATVTGGNTVTLLGQDGLTITANDSGTSDGVIDLVLDSNPAGTIVESGFETVGITTNDSVSNISFALTTTSTDGNDTTITLTAGNDVTMAVASSGAGGVAVNAGVTGAYTDGGSVLDHDTADTTDAAATYTAVATGAIAATVDARAVGATAAVSLTSTANDVTTTVTLDESNDTDAVTLGVTAGQDIVLTGVTMTGGGAGSSVTATAARELTTGGAISAANVVGGADITLVATSNDVNLGGTLTSKGTTAASGDISLTAGLSILGGADLNAGGALDGGTVTLTTGAVGASTVGNIDGSGVTIGAGNDVTATSVDASVIVVTGAGDVNLGNVKSYNVAAGNATGIVTATLAGDVSGTGINTAEFTSGTANDALTLNDAAIAYTASTGDGVDALTVTAAGNSTVNLGGGADTAAINSTTTTKVTVNGDAGADTLTAATNVANDVFNGGAGNDKLILAGAVAATGFTFDGGADNDTVKLASADYSADNNLEFKNIEVIDITAGAASINADNIDNDSAFELNGANNFTIVIDSGDTVDASNISFIPGAVADVLFTAAAGAETITGTDLVDIIDGLAGDDIINGGAGGDTLTGGNDDDTVNGDGGADIIIGGSGADILNGGNDADTITGGAGIDVINGGSGDDKFVYTASANFVSANAVIDSVDGGQGTGDTIQIANNGLATFTIAQTDVLTRLTNVESITAAPTDNIISITLDDSQSAVLTTVDLSGDTTVTANNVIDVSDESSSAYTLKGSTGIDTITGGAGGDIITGGGAADIINGGNGQDTYSTATAAESKMVNANAARSGFDVVSVTDTDLFAGATIAAVISAEKAEGNAVDANGDDMITSLNTAFQSVDDGVANIEAGVIAYTGGEQFLVIDLNSDQAITDADIVIQLVGTVTGLTLTSGAAEIDG